MNEYDPNTHFVLPKEPPPGLLMSMALRMDHALGCPGYYDEMIGLEYEEGRHQKRLDSMLTDMRRIWEEISGKGFYRPIRENEYQDLELRGKQIIK